MTPTEVYEAIVRILTYPVPISVGGDLQFSVASLLEAALIFFILVRLSRSAQRILRQRVLDRVSIDQGLAYTLQRMLHYAILTLAVLLALKIGVSLDFTSVAVVLTALSVGIGLGLKEIAGDVAAGFILLFERPIRVGDRVRLESNLHLEGDVVAIDLRTTKIRTNDALTVIVPNSKLTNEEYVNWSYTNAPVRLHIPIGVSYNSDVDVVCEALLSATDGVDRLVENPKPSVRLVNFNSSSIDFELLVWTLDPDKHPQISSDLNFKIWHALKDAGIEIPFPQQDLHVKTLPPEVQKVVSSTDF